MNQAFSPTIMGLIINQIIIYLSKKTQLKEFNKK